MLLSATLFVLSAYFLFFFFSIPYFEQILGLTLNLLMILIILFRFGFNIAKKRLLSGEILPSIFYITWLFLYPHPEFIYTLPLAISFVGKIYLLTSHPSKLEVDAVEDLILLESKVQIFLILYHPVSAINKLEPVIKQIIDLTFFFATMKLKYSIHYGTRKAYQDLHFSLDKISKQLNIRRGYQKVQGIFGQMGGYTPSLKQITY